MSPVAVLLTIVATLDDIKEGPESSFYLPFMGKISLDTFNGVMGIIRRMGLCKIEGHYVTFTTPTAGSDGEAVLNEARKILSGIRTNGYKIPATV